MSLANRSELLSIIKERVRKRNELKTRNCSNGAKSLFTNQTSVTESRLEGSSDLAKRLHIRKCFNTILNEESNLLSETLDKDEHPRRASSSIAKKRCTENHPTQTLCNLPLPKILRRCKKKNSAFLQHKLSQISFKSNGNTTPEILPKIKIFKFAGCVETPPVPSTKLSKLSLNEQSKLTVPVSSGYTLMPSKCHWPIALTLQFKFPNGFLTFLHPEFLTF